MSHSTFDSKRGLISIPLQIVIQYNQSQKILSCQNFYQAQANVELIMSLEYLTFFFFDFTTVKAFMLILGCSHEQAK